MCIVESNGVGHHAQRTCPPSQAGYYVAEQHNPGIATLSTHGLPRTYHQDHRPVAEQVSSHLAYGGPGMDEMRESPGRYQVASGRSPLGHPHGYAQAVHPSPYSLPHGSTLESQGSVMQYQQTVPHHMVRSHQHVPVQASTPANPAGHYHQSSAPVESGPWYQYQSPVEVATIGQLPVFGSGVFDMYGAPKLEFDDPSIQMPSARVETM